MKPIKRLPKINSKTTKEIGRTTHEQIGEKLNLSRQRIGQIEKKFVEKLRTINKMTTVLDTKRLED